MTGGRDDRGREDGRTGGREDGRTGGREDGKTGRREDGRTGRTINGQWSTVDGQQMTFAIRLLVLRSLFLFGFLGFLAS